MGDDFLVIDEQCDRDQGDLPVRGVLVTEEPAPAHLSHRIGLGDVHGSVE